MKVLVDSSFLMLLVEKPLQDMKVLEEEFGKTQLIVLECVLNELKRLSRIKSIKRARLAGTALRFASRLEKIVYNNHKDVDTNIIEYATGNQIPVATIDTELKNELRKKSVVVVSVRNDRIIIDGSLLLLKKH